MSAGATADGGQALRRFLERRTGFSIPDDRWGWLAPRFLARIEDRGFGDVESYLGYLEADPLGQREQDELLNALTVRKTSFFRNPALFSALRQLVLPDMIKSRQQDPDPAPLSIWSAGCATGEEAYSLAMTATAAVDDALANASGEHDLSESGELFGIRRYVLGTDIVPDAIVAARQGSYPAASLEGVPQDYREHLRHVGGKPESGGRVWIRQAIREAVEFSVHNLVHDPPPRSASGFWDVISCRNVLIYFGLDQARAVLEQFSEVLAPGGALFLGHAEVFTDIEDDYEVVFHDTTFFYRKRLRRRSRPTTRRLRAPSGKLPWRRDGGAAALPPEHTGRSPGTGRIKRPPTSKLGRPPATPPQPELPTRAQAEPRPFAQVEASARRAVDEARKAKNETRRLIRLVRPDGETAGLADPKTGERHLLPPNDELPATRRWDGSAPDGPGPRRGSGRYGPRGETPTRAFVRPTDRFDDPFGSDTRPEQRPASEDLFGLVQRAENLLRDDQPGRAEALLGQAITESPRWSRPRVTLAEALRLQDRPGEAIRQLEAAIDVAPLDARAHFSLGRIRSENKEHSQAEVALRKALYLDPELHSARFWLAEVLRHTGRPERAARELRTVLRALRLDERRTSQDAERLDALRERCEAVLAELS